MTLWRPRGRSPRFAPVWRALGLAGVSADHYHDADGWHLRLHYVRKHKGEWVMSPFAQFDDADETQVVANAVSMLDVLGPRLALAAVLMGDVK